MSEDDEETTQLNGTHDYDVTVTTDKEAEDILDEASLEIDDPIVQIQEKDYATAAEMLSDLIAKLVAVHDYCESKGE